MYKHVLIIQFIHIYMLFDRISIKAIHDQEDEVEILKSKCDKAREDLANAKLKLREQLNEGLGMETKEQAKWIKFP